MLILSMFCSVAWADVSENEPEVPAESAELPQDAVPMAEENAEAEETAVPAEPAESAALPDQPAPQAEPAAEQPEAVSDAPAGKPAVSGNTPSEPETPVVTEVTEESSSTDQASPSVPSSPAADMPAEATAPVSESSSDSAAEPEVNAAPAADEVPETEDEPSVPGQAAEADDAETESTVPGQTGGIPEALEADVPVQPEDAPASGEPVDLILAEDLPETVPAGETAVETAAEETAVQSETVEADEEAAADSEAEQADSGADVLSGHTEIQLPEEDEQAEAPSDVLTAASQGYTEASDVLPASSVPTTGTEGFVYRLYKIVHGREPDPVGFRYWVDNLNNGRFTAADVVVRFFDSTEYMQSGRSNDEIVRNCYETMLGRQPDPEGFAYWKEKLDIGMTQDTLLAGFVRSSEFAQISGSYGITPGTITLTNPQDKNFYRTFFVYRLYRNCLGRNPDKTGMAYWCQQLENGLPGVDIVHKFIFGPECDGFRYDNYAFTEMLYRTIHGRQYDEDGFKYWTNLLNYTASRERVVNRFALGPEFGSQCSKASINVGSAAYEPDNDPMWQYNIEILRLCNNSRRAAGLPDLYTREDLLKDLAMLRAEEITRYFSHTRPNGKDCFSLFTQQGFYGYLGENLAGGFDSPQLVFNGWMNSPGHRANIMNKNYTYLATGYLYNPDASTYCGEGQYTGQHVKFNHYWAQSFCNYSHRIN